LIVAVNGGNVRPHYTATDSAGAREVYRPTTRVLATLELLQAHRQLTGKELAARLEVHLRTARRYVEILQDLGIPVEVVRGPHGGYRLRSDFKLPPLMFTDAEAAAVVLGLMAAARVGRTAADPATQTALAKLRRALPPALASRAGSLAATVRLEPSVEIPPVDVEVLTTVTVAAGEGRRVAIHYRSRRDDVTERIVDPYGVVCDAGRWYLIGYCALRSAQRMFRLDRVVSAASREDAFTPPPGFDLRREFEGAMARVPGKWPVTVLFETTAEDARARLWPLVGTIRDVEAGAIYQVNASDLDWVARHLAGRGVPFTVLGPPELNDALRRYADEIVARANGASIGQTSVIGSPWGTHGVSPAT
jgi:predicted DNA-binding transcriptional regulator YafY